MTAPWKDCPTCEGKGGLMQLVGDEPIPSEQREPGPWETGWEPCPTCLAHAAAVREAVEAMMPPPDGWLENEQEITAVTARNISSLPLPGED